MPIRLCQKCGLKVLIDESQAGTNPFYCQRCTTAMKGQENAPAPPAPRNATPSPVANMSGRSDPAAPSVPSAAKAATVRVLCPYCKASFNGRVPQKPARGSCPVCQKELILLPNGDIKPAAGFDLGQYQNEPAGAKGSEPMAPEVKESGTRLLVKKYAAEQPSSAGRPAAKNEETDASEEAGALPGWLDDSAQGGAPVKPQPDTDVAIDVVEPPRAEEPEAPPTPIEEQAPPPVRARSPIVAKMQTMSSGKPPTAIVPAPESSPSPEVDLLPDEPAPKPRALGRVPSGERKAPGPVPAAAAPGETGSGKVFLALILALLPIAAGAGLLSQRDQLKQEIVKKIGARFVAGFAKLDQKLFPPPPPPKPKVEEKAPEPEPPPKEEPPKADPEQQKKDELAITHTYEQILRMKRDLKQSSVAATPEQKAQLKEVEKKIQENEDKYSRLRAMYQKMYGKEYDPTK